MKESCCVADSFCKAPANLDDRERPILRGWCFSCGQAVCGNCSSIRKFKPISAYGRRRVCNNCQIENLDGGNDRVVMARMQSIAESSG